MATETAILAGGCFWGAQQLLRRRPGVISTRVGYSGGDTPNATYRNHGDHAEAVEIVFDPSQISYRDLLEFFFQIHDPSTKDRQGNDIGRSYRSAIFYTSDEQKRVALDTIADVDASGLWPGKVVTEVAPAGDFWEAEEEHQDYLEKYPNGYTCHFVRPNWKLPHRAEEVIPARCLSPNRVPEVLVVSTPFPPDDRSIGYERGSAVSKEWDAATTDAAFEIAAYVSSHVAELAGIRQPPKYDPGSPSGRTFRRSRGGEIRFRRSRPTCGRRSTTSES